jgi:hypothetical protein
VHRALHGVTGMRRNTVTRQRPDAIGHGRRGAVASTSTEEALVARLEALSAEFAATPDEEFRAATRARLVAMAAVRTPAAEAARRPPVRVALWRRLLADDPDGPAARWKSRLTAGLAGAALTVTVLGGLFGAAQQARPGDLLYDLKRGGEQTQLALAGDARRGTTLLDFASTRLDELNDLLGVAPGADAVVGSTPSGGELGLAAAGPDVDLVLETLQTMDAQTTEGTAAMTARAVRQADAHALDVLTAWAGEQQSGLSELTDAMPEAALGALDGSLDLLDDVGLRGSALEESVLCAAGPATRGSDELGPRPDACPPPSPATTGAPSSSDRGASTSGTAGTSGTSGGTSSAPGTTDSPTATGGTASGTEPSTSTTGRAPTTAGPGSPPTGSAPTTASPSSPSSPGLPLPSVPGLPLPSVPGLPLPSGSLPSLPGSPPSVPSAGPTPPSSGSSPLVDVPPLVPGVTVCLPPLVGVGC